MKKSLYIWGEIRQNTLQNRAKLDFKCLENIRIKYLQT